MTARIAGGDIPGTLYQRLAAKGQQHVLRWWDDLSAAERELLCRQLETIDLDLLGRLFGDATNDHSSVGEIRPAPAIRLDAAADPRATQAGERALRAGEVAVVLVAGGQGTRLGHDGPKGMYEIGPISRKSLFQIHAEKVLALSRRFGKPLPLYVMTSAENDAPTREFFESRRCFGLARDQVIYFQQGTMPAVDSRTGKLVLAGKSSLALSPNGHGGVLQALADGGHLARMGWQGIRYLFYYQVDNPLVKVADPVYLGQHIQSGAEMSLKVVPKLHAGEKMGVVVEVDGRLRIIEYSDLPADLAAKRGPDGGLAIWAGSIAVHVFNLAFLERLAQRGNLLPYHRALKKVPCVDESGRTTQPAEPNAVKFEMFVFDALPLAAKALVVETGRREEFEPLKNATGENSPQTVQQAIADLGADWLRRAGIEVPRRADGSAAVPVEIGPLFALDADELRARLPRREPVTGPLLLDDALEPALH